LDLNLPSNWDFSLATLNNNCATQPYSNMATKREDEMIDEFSSDEDSFPGLDSDNDAPQMRKSATTLFDKDSDEEELERLVLGDESTFRDNLLKGSEALGDILDSQYGDLQLAEHDAGGLEDIQDADLFMLDTGLEDAVGKASRSQITAQKAEQAGAPAWEDSDDDRLEVSLAGATRLRKLRVAEAEDTVSGTEYSRRLRQQFERLNPPPAWAKQNSEERSSSKRRRRRSSNSAASGSDSSEDSEMGSDSDDATAQPLEKFLRDVNQLAGLGGSKKRRLRPEVIDIQRTRDIPDKHRAAVECLSFHPEYPVLLSASTASILYLHHIAPEAQPTPNPQLTSVQVKQVDVRRAEFLYPDGDKIFFGGRRKYFHQWDLRSGAVQKTTQVLGHRLEHKTMERFRLSPCGRYVGVVASTRKGGGIVNVLSCASMQWVAAARLSSHNGVADFAWWGNGEGMTVLGKDGQVGEYSMESRSFVGVWMDEGCVGAIVIALGGHQGPVQLGEDRWVAVGSNSGITNIYDRTNLIVRPTASSAPTTTSTATTIKERPTPTRTFEQLVTPITALAFSPDGQLLAFGSRHQKDALRLAHLPTCTVYRNWPTEQTPLGRITAVAFGRGSDVLAVGNDAGKIRLWEIRS
jgi:WD40 repeat protein